MMIAALPLVSAAVTAVGGSSATSTAARIAAPSLGVPGPSSDGFSSLLASFTQNAVGKMQTSEQMSAAGIEGKASTQSVVEAVMAAQESLQTALAVRDKAVAAFQDISRMPI